jgi:hypothetical protein
MNTTTSPGPWQRYRKTAPTIVRTLTELDYAECGGIIQTPEGPASFLPGDALAKDANGMWPIAVQVLRTHYIRGYVLDSAGWTLYLCLEEREAAQITDPDGLTIGSLHGKVGDYVVRAASGEQWIVNQDIFEATYRRESEQNNE